MVKTAQEPASTKDRLLDAAERLMRAKGFSATSVEEICDAAKLTKGSFFHYFENKEALGKAVLERFCADTKERFAGACSDSSDPLERVYNHIDCAIAVARDPSMLQGCLLGTFAQELSDTNPAIRSMCAKKFGEWSAALTSDLAAAKAKYAPKSAIDPKSLAEHFIAVLEGSQILAKTQRDTKVIEQNLEHFRRYLKSLFSRP